MIRLPKMHSEENKDITPEEKVFLASLIKMSKVLKQERRQHSLYQQPLRLYVSADFIKFATFYNDTKDSFPTTSLIVLNEFTVPAKFLQQLDPQHTHMAIDASRAEYPISFHNLKGYDDTTNAPEQYTSESWKYLSKFISVPTITSPQYYNSFTGEYWSRLPFINPSSSSPIGLPLSDTNFINNQQLTFKFLIGEYGVGNGTSGMPITPRLGVFQGLVKGQNGINPVSTNAYLVFTVVFYRCAGNPEE